MESSWSLHGVFMESMRTPWTPRGLHEDSMKTMVNFGEVCLVECNGSIIDSLVYCSLYD